MDYNEQIWNRELQKRQINDHLDLCKAEAKAQIQVQKQLAAYQERQRIKAAEEERKRGIYEELSITASGDLIMKTKNLSFPALPRVITNMKRPQLTVLIRKDDPSEKAYLLECAVEEKKVQVYLDCENAGNATYVLRKFTARGIIFKMPRVKAKDVVGQLLAMLLPNCVSEEIPDDSGWMEQDGKFIYWEEGAITWKEIRKYVR